MMMYFVARYVVHADDKKRRRYFLTEDGNWTTDREVATTFPGRATAKAAAKRRPGSFVDGIRDRKEADDG